MNLQQTIPRYAFPPAPKRKVFISFHHNNDQVWFDHFVKIFSDKYDVFQDNSLGKDLVNSNDPEYINKSIREDYIKGSSITIVLCGSESWKRKFIDWEIYSTLHHEHALLGLLIPGTPLTPQNTVIVPDRFHDNIQSGYAHWANWTNDPLTLKQLIETTIQKSSSKESIRNSRLKMVNNL